MLHLPLMLFGSVPVEQVETYDGTPVGAGSTGYDPYAPLNFSGSMNITVSGNADGGEFNNITFHANYSSGFGQTDSAHAQSVGDDIYGSDQSPAYPFVTNVYDIYANTLLYYVLNPQGAPGVGAVPGSFAGQAVVINNSYVSNDPTTGAYLDANRRLDYMINQADAVWVAAAVTSVAGYSTPEYLSWSNFNSLAVSGVQDSQQSFNPAGSPGKQHADLSMPNGTDASFATATVSGYAAALWGNAQANGQADAQHGILIRSLLMSGAEKSSYNRPADGALDPINGAGQPDYDNSLAILNGGEKPLAIVSPTGSISGPIGTNQQGWASGIISPGTQSAVLFQSAFPILGLTASLNWDVTSQATGNQLNTSNGALIFPNLTLEVRPVTYSSSTGKYTLGASESDPTLHSAIPGDNVQYLYSTSTLHAGSYAFLIGGDPALPANVGFSYTLVGAFASQWTFNPGTLAVNWNAPGNWTNGIPNGLGAQATLSAGPGASAPATIALNSDVTVGQLTFNAAGNCTLSSGAIAGGTTGTLKIDDTGDPTYNPSITVQAGVLTISAPVHFDWGLTAAVAAGASLNLSGGSSGVSSLNKNGAGLLIISGSANYSGGTIINSGTISLGAAATLAGTITINTGGTLNFAANPAAGFLIRNQQIVIGSGAAVTLSPAAAAPSRQLLIAPNLSLAGIAGAWTGTLDLANNDLELPAGSLATITSQLQQGYNTGNWNGTGGILSSTAAADPDHLTALGVIQNNQPGTPLFSAGNAFDGTVPGPADILVKYTYFGDANLDGKIDGSDYSLIDNGYTSNGQLTGWYNGDFNYDGIINGSDYTLIDNAFNQQGISLAAAVDTTQIATTTVPESESLALAAIAALGLLARRRSCSFKRLAQTRSN